MRSLQQLLDTYGESHVNTTNKAIHWICVPAIFFSIVGFFYAIPIGNMHKTMWINVGSIALLAVLIYYFRLSVTMALGFVIWGAFCLWGNGFIYQNLGSSNSSLAITSLSIFVVAWIFQFVGHKIEGKKPSFLEDIQFLLIGPAWLMSFIYRKLGLRY
ncbi:MAG: YGL010W-like membrane protein [Bacteroidia bacterium]|jgi:uncharacterized membrane protein YGL010W